MAVYAVLSDIHGNMYALSAVLRDLERFDTAGLLLLGDSIDYGMQSNEVTAVLRDRLHDRLLCHIWGNHERAILCGDYRGFSSARGVASAQYTDSVLSEGSRRYLEENAAHSGKACFALDGLSCLAVHASLDDPYWKAIAPGELRGDYAAYDLVLSGHSHIPHVFSAYYPCDDPARRNSHAVLFVNPGSIGQPRNHRPEAQYALLDTETMSVTLRCVPYDVEGAMSLYHGQVDPFYRDRLKTGV